MHVCLHELKDLQQTTALQLAIGSGRGRKLIFQDTQRKSDYHIIDMFTGVFIASIWWVSEEHGCIHSPITFEYRTAEHTCPHHTTNLICIPVSFK